jgi:hypothetical protein
LLSILASHGAAQLPADLASIGPLRPELLGAITRLVQLLLRVAHGSTRLAPAIGGWLLSLLGVLEEAAEGLALIASAVTLPSGILLIAAG